MTVTVRSAARPRRRATPARRRSAGAHRRPAARSVRTSSPPTAAGGAHAAARPPLLARCRRPRCSPAKQRDLCLLPATRSCATYRRPGSARRRRGPEPGAPDGRPVAGDPQRRRSSSSPPPDSGSCRPSAAGVGRPGALVGSWSSPSSPCSCSRATCRPASGGSRPPRTPSLRAPSAARPRLGPTPSPERRAASTAVAARRPPAPASATHRPRPRRRPTRETLQVKAGDTLASIALGSA